MKWSEPRDVNLSDRGGIHARMLWMAEDATGRYAPDGWANKVLEVFDRWKGDKIVAEKNFGGAMVESTIRTARKSIAHARLPHRFVPGALRRRLEDDPRVNLPRARAAYSKIRC